MKPRLPAILEEIADVVGLAAAVAIADARGGQQVFIPNIVGDDHWLVALIGAEKARELAAYFTHAGGVHILIPKAQMLRHQKRIDLVRKLLAEGRSANDIAARTDLSRRDVFRKKQQLRERQQHPQRDLFTDED